MGGSAPILLLRIPSKGRWNYQCGKWLGHWSWGTMANIKMNHQSSWLQPIKNNNNRPVIITWTVIVRKKCRSRSTILLDLCGVYLFGRLYVEAGMASPFTRWFTHSCSRVGRKDGETFYDYHKNAHMERNVVKRLKVGSWGKVIPLSQLYARWPRKPSHWTYSVITCINTIINAHIPPQASKGISIQNVLTQILHV